MSLYRLNKIPLMIKNGAADFLSGLTSNTVEARNNAFLNIHGRIVATFDQLKLSEEQVLILIEEPFVEAALAHIGRYVTLSGVLIEKLSCNVYFDLTADTKVEEGDFVISQKSGQILVSSRDLEADVSQEEFTRFRLKHNIPLQGIDYTDEFLLNVSTTDFVSFTKGCFLGQEPVSKVYNRSKPTWALKVCFEDECSQEEKPKMTSKITDESGRIFGFVFVK